MFAVIDRNDFESVNFDANESMKFDYDDYSVYMEQKQAWAQS